MNKLLVGIILGLAVIALLLVNLTRVVQGPPQPLGARPDASISRIASTTLDGLGTYFGDEGGTVVGGRRTASTTLVTMRGVYKYDFVSIDAVSVSTTTSNGGTVYLQPETSLDAVTWVAVPIGDITNTGTFTKDITILAGTASSTFVWLPSITGTGTSTVVLPPLRDIPGDFFRVKVSSTGTSTLSM